MTLVEVLVVIIVLSIIALVVVPEFSSATTAGRDASLRANLRMVRAQISLYKIEHNDAYPPFATFSDVMTLASKADHTTAAIGTGGFPFGPYMRSIPPNPFNSLATLKATLDGTTGWTYNETTGAFNANDGAHDTW
jgi:type II secretory pathway pseudopilin PulG